MKRTTRTTHTRTASTRVPAVFIADPDAVIIPTYKERIVTVSLTVTVSDSESMVAIQDGVQR